jgi:uncharacterized protein with GYD domain
MAQYVYLVKFTQQGIANAKDTVQRAEAFKAMAQSMGGSVSTLLWTLGKYDLVCILEAPDDETAAAISLKIAGLGNVRPMTMRAFSAEEAGTIIGKLG